MLKNVFSINARESGKLVDDLSTHSHSVCVCAR
jgi:hypothetical protein